MSRSRDLASRIINTATGGVLTLRSSDTTITDGSVLGKLEFNAPDEGSGTDALLVGAAIWAVAEGTFTASSNASELVFMTGSSEAASSKMVLSSAGALDVTGVVSGAGFTAGNAVIAEAELELLDGLTAGTAIASKVITTDANIDTSGQRNLTITGELDAATGDFSGAVDVAGTLTTVAITASGVITGTAFTAGSAVLAEAELELLDGLTAGTAIASKVVTTDANIDTTGQRNLTITGELDAATLDISGAIDIAGNSVLASVDVTGVATAATFEPDGDTAAGDNAAIGFTSAEGLILTGQGSTNDITIKNDADADVITIATGTTVVGIPGSLDIEGAIDVNGTTNLDVVDIDGAVDMATTLAVAGNVDFNGDLDVDGTTNLDVVDIDGAVDMASTLAVAGVLTGASLDISGDIDIDGTANLDVVDIDGAVDMATTLTVGGEITAASLDISGNVDIDGTLETDALSINSTTVTSTAAELNILDGVTSTAAELNILDGVTSTAAELNILDGVTSTAAELNALDGITAVVGELNALDIGSTAVGTAVASKAVILDSNKDYTGMRNLTISGELDAGSLDISGNADIDGTLETDALSINGTAVTSTAAELNALDGITAVVGELNALDIGSTAIGTAVASKAVILDSNKDYTGFRNFTITGNLVVGGTTTVVDTVTMNAENAVVFEGATADGNETTLTIVDPDADRTIKLPNQSGTIPVLAAVSATAITSTPEELNILDGVTSTAAELNILDGVTSTAAELNILDGVTSTAAELNILDGVTSTAAELNILDGVTTTAAEINLIDGGTSRGTTAVADGDGILINDGGTMRMTTVQTVSAYMAAESVGGAAMVTTGALNAGSITSGFGTINNGSSTITTSGTVATGAITAGGNLTRGGTVILDGSITDTGDFTIDVAGDLILDAAGDDILLKSAGTHEGNINFASSNLTFKSIVSDKDMIFQGNDGGSAITALTLDMSAAGAATFNNDVTAFSDERLKSNITTIPDALSKVIEMRGVHYVRDATGQASTGVIAQELQKIAPELVRTADDEMGTLSVNYGNITGYLIEAIKELSAKVKELEGK